nr:17 beta-hydroxysteroid dehydrogenase 12 [Sinonovacula constricta]
MEAVLGRFTGAFAAFGVVTLSYIALKICLTVLKMLRMAVMSKTKSITKGLLSHGSWAVVTGATDGIGKEYAKELASCGFNIVLISRTKSKLEAVASEIEGIYKVKTKIITADFTQGYSIYDGIRRDLNGLEIGVLVNNVGLSYAFPEYFLDIPDREKLFADLLHVNCSSVTMMSSIVMPGMAERRKGVVINISSASGLSPTPLLSVYSACKAYVTYLTECLQMEYNGKGLTVQCVSPYFVCTNMSKISRPSLLIPSASTFVRSALGTVGSETNTLGYWPHQMVRSVLSNLPFDYGQTISFNNLKSACKRAKKKMEAKKSK